MECPKCLEKMPDDDVFCEVCGNTLTAAAPPSLPTLSSATCACGAAPAEIGDDGFCSRCGRRVLPPPEDHIELALSPDCAAVCDRGRKHARNEDRFALCPGKSGYVLVVCDGVSSSRQAEEASAAASQCVADRLCAADTADQNDVRDAIAAAQEQLVAEASRWDADASPSTTIVAAMVANGRAVIGWVGDSRAYWIGPESARQLTEDHSWINSVVASGEMTEQQAAKAPQAHGITHWLGADAGRNAAADIVEFRVPNSGILLVCSDGLWNYASTPEEMATAVRRAATPGADALAIARNLVAFANARGGHDNITAIVLRVRGGAGDSPANPSEAGDIRASLGWQAEACPTTDAGLRKAGDGQTSDLSEAGDIRASLGWQAEACPTTDAALRKSGDGQTSHRSEAGDVRASLGWQAEACPTTESGDVHAPDPSDARECLATPLRGEPHG